MDKPTQDDFYRLADSLGVKNFDLVVVADGSGSVANEPCGYYAASLWRWGPDGGTVCEHFGGASGGTNNYAELTPFLFVLWQFQALYQREIVAYQPLQVLCVSDSEVTVKCGAGEYARNANLLLWASIDCLEEMGFDFTWRHVPRNSNPINTRADEQAKRIRKMFCHLSE